MKTINGNLIELAKQGQFDGIGHGCNCFHTWGAGIAKQMKEEFPEAYEADLSTIKGDWKKLGDYSEAQCGEVLVLNLYTQFAWGPGKQVEYSALADVCEKLEADFNQLTIGIPLIGGGLGGGSKEVVLDIMNTYLGDNVTLVLYP